MKEAELSKVVISKEVFPAFRSLTIDYARGPYGKPREFEISTLSTCIEATAITSLVIKDADTRSRNGVPLFVRRYGQHLISLAIQGGYITSWADLLEVARQCRLEGLYIAQFDEGLWERITTEREQQFHNFSRVVLESISPEALESVAKVVVTSPLGFVEA